MTQLRQAGIDTSDLDFRQERHAKYQGTARVDISHLRVNISSPPRQAHCLRPKNIARLENIFATEGCHRLDPAHHVAALISQSELLTLLRNANIDQAALLNPGNGEGPPKLEMTGKATLRVLHGQHRLEAARRHLAPSDAWWTVDFYSNDMSSDLIANLREEYANSAIFSDGEIFRHIRMYHKREQEREEKTWWARLTRDKAKDLKRILAVKELREGFDNLLGISGLWDAFHIGTMRRYMVLKCHEVIRPALRRLAHADNKQELATYLRHIRDVWSQITGSDIAVLNLVDSATVKNLELRAPAASERDAGFARRCMSNGKIFATILQPVLRETVLHNIFAVEGTIPSLFTFCENTKHLEPCAKAIKTLIGTPISGTLCAALKLLFEESGQGNSARQDSEHQFTIIKTHEEDQFPFCYRQLWMYAMRHFPNLVNVAPRKEPYREKPIIREPNPVLWYRFAKLALRLGFYSQKLKQMGSAAALDQAIRDGVFRVKSAREDSTSRDYQVSVLRQQLETESESTPETPPPLTSDNTEIDLQHRCGRPFEDSQEEAKAGLFTAPLYCSEEPRGQYISSFFIHRSTFQAFFGSTTIRTIEQGPLNSYGDDSNMSDVIISYESPSSTVEDNPESSRPGNMKTSLPEPDNNCNSISSGVPEAIHATLVDGAASSQHPENGVDSIDSIVMAHSPVTSSPPYVELDSVSRYIQSSTPSAISGRSPRIEASRPGDHMSHRDIPQISLAHGDLGPWTTRSNMDSASLLEVSDADSEWTENPALEWDSILEHNNSSDPITTANLMMLGSPPLAAEQPVEDESIFRSYVPLEIGSSDDVSTVLALDEQYQQGVLNPVTSLVLGQAIGDSDIERASDKQDVRSPENAEALSSSDPVISRLPERDVTTLVEPSEACMLTETDHDNSFMPRFSYEQSKPQLVQSDPLAGTDSYKRAAYVDPSSLFKSPTVQSSMFSFEPDRDQVQSNHTIDPGLHTIPEENMTAQNGLAGSDRRIRELKRDNASSHRLASVMPTVRRNNSRVRPYQKSLRPTRLGPATNLPHGIDTNEVEELLPFSTLNSRESQAKESSRQKRPLRVSEVSADTLLSYKRTGEVEGTSERGDHKRQRLNDNGLAKGT